jgi:hypothetical protein
MANSGPPLLLHPFDVLRREFHELRTDVQGKLDSLRAENDGLKEAKESAEDQIAALGLEVGKLRLGHDSLQQRVAEIESLAGGVDPPTSRVAYGEEVAPEGLALSVRSAATEATGAQPEAPNAKPRKRRPFLPSEPNAKPNLNIDEFRSGETETCELAESVWESPLFLGRTDLGMGRVVTLWTVLVLLLNTLLQCTIAVIVVLKMGESSIIARTIEDLWYTRSPLRYCLKQYTLLGHDAVPGAAADAARRCFGCRASVVFPLSDDRDQ